MPKKAILNCLEKREWVWLWLGIHDLRLDFETDDSKGHDFLKSNICIFVDIEKYVLFLKHDDFWQPSGMRQISTGQPWSMEGASPKWITFGFKDYVVYDIIVCHIVVHLWGFLLIARFKKCEQTETVFVNVEIKTTLFMTTVS